MRNFPTHNKSGIALWPGCGETSDQTSRSWNFAIILASKTRLVTSTVPQHELPGCSGTRRSAEALEPADP
jgi:hypothetical protein